MSRIGPLWLNKLVDEADHDTFDDFVSKIKANLANRSIADSTLNTYCTTAYAALIDRGKITVRKPDGRIKLHDLYKKWLLAQRIPENNRSPEDLKLTSTSFFRPTWEKKLTLNVFRPGGVKKIIRESKRKLTEKPALNIANPQLFLQVVLSGLVSSDPSSMYTALLLCSGRRASTFILYPDAFEPIGGRDDVSVEDYECFYTEHLKVGTSLPEKRRIPLLAPYCYFRECLDAFVLSQKSVLEVKKCSTAMELQGRFGKQYNRWVRRRTGGFKPHDMRSLYAAYCIRLYAGEQDPMTYIHKSLTHKSDLSTALHYSRVHFLKDDKLEEWVPQVDDKSEYVIHSAYKWVDGDGVGKSQSELEAIELRKKVKALEQRQQEQEQEHDDDQDQEPKSKRYKSEV